MDNPKILDNNGEFDKLVSEAFNEIDIDKSGTICNREFKLGLGIFATRAGLPTPTDEAIRDLFVKLDQDDNGKLSVDEFAVLIKRILS